MPQFGDSQFKDVGHMVRHLKNTEQECQLNRNYLVLRVWEELNNITFTKEQKEEVKRCVPVETISRMLRFRQR